MAEENQRKRGDGEMFECGSSTCRLHSGMAVQASEFGRRLSDHHSDRKIMWDAIKDKVPIRYFILLVVFVVGGLGFQLMIYDSIKTVDKKMAVIEVSVAAALAGHQIKLP